MVKVVCDVCKNIIDLSTGFKIEIMPNLQNKKDEVHSDIYDICKNCIIDVKSCIKGEI